jgi:PilZ domain
MDTGLSGARQARVHPRHELHTLTYVTLDQANGGIVRDISHGGVGVQMVAAAPPGQQLRVRFELNHPRLCVETLGEVSWSRRSGQCGIRFLDLSPSMGRRINEWIFGNLLEEASKHCAQEGSIFAGTIFAGTPGTVAVRDADHEDDGVVDDCLMVSAAPVQVIEMPAGTDLPSLQAVSEHSGASRLDWLFHPLSGRGLVWTINTLVVVAALLLFALIFLSITGEPPRWPVATASAAAIFVAALYWGFFRLFGGLTPGARLARMAGLDLEEKEEAADARFR